MTNYPRCTSCDRRCPGREDSRCMEGAAGFSFFLRLSRGRRLGRVQVQEAFNFSMGIMITCVQGSTNTDKPFCLRLIPVKAGM